MKDFLIFFCIGLITMILGIVCLKREKRLLKDPVSTYATVTGYDEYQRMDSDLPGGFRLMYTMVAEYRLLDGKQICSREQKGSGSKKFEVGTEINIEYSREKPDFFIVKGDKSRFIALYAMIVMGVFMIATSLFILYRGV